MYISNKLKNVKIYCITTLFCVAFSFIYSQFSHGVSSPHMTYLFLYPLLLGVVVEQLLIFLKITGPDYFWPMHFYHTGVVALILGSLLRGIFEIAGTASFYQIALSVGGIVLIFCGIIMLLIIKIKS